MKADAIGARRPTNRTGILRSGRARAASSTARRRSSASARPCADVGQLVREHGGNLGWRQGRQETRADDDGRVPRASPDAERPWEGVVDQVELRGLDVELRCDPVAVERSSGSWASATAAHEASPGAHGRRPHRRRWTRGASSGEEDRAAAVGEQPPKPAKPPRAASTRSQALRRCARRPPAPANPGPASSRVGRPSRSTPRARAAASPPGARRTGSSSGA